MNTTKNGTTPDDITQDGDGYLSEDLKVDVGSFSLDSLDLGEEDKKEDEKKGGK